MEEKESKPTNEELIRAKLAAANKKLKVAMEKEARVGRTLRNEDIVVEIRLGGKRFGGFGGGDEGPVVAPFGAFGDPLFEESDLFFGEVVAGFDGGHAVVFVGDDQLVEFAGFGVAWDDGVVAAQVGECALVCIES